MSEQVKELGSSRASSDAAGKHTPGPWDFDPGDLTIYAFDERGGTIPLLGVHSDCDGDMMPLGEAVANVRLAAAAPELLEALKALPTEWLNRGVLKDARADGVRIEMRIVGTNYETTIPVASLRSAADAISKAEGAS